jgi:hypothetical protein
MLTNDHLVHHYAKHKNGMPKCGGPNTKFRDDDEQITRSNTTPKMKTVYQKAGDTTRSSAMLPTNDLMQHCANKKRDAKMRRTQNGIP